jgi:hypothetical protein
MAPMLHWMRAHQEGVCPALAQGATTQLYARGKAGRGPAAVLSPRGSAAAD